MNANATFVHSDARIIEDTEDEVMVSNVLRIVPQAFKSKPRHRLSYQRRMSGLNTYRIKYG